MNAATWVGIVLATAGSFCALVANVGAARARRFHARALDHLEAAQVLHRANSGAPLSREDAELIVRIAHEGESG